MSSMALAASLASLKGKQIVTIYSSKRCEHGKSYSSKKKKPQRVFPFYADMFYKSMEAEIFGILSRHILRVNPTVRFRKRTQSCALNVCKCKKLFPSTAKLAKKHENSTSPFLQPGWFQNNFNSI